MWIILVLGIIIITLLLIRLINYAPKLYYASKGATFLGSITLATFLNTLRGGNRIELYAEVYKKIREDRRTDGRVGVGEELGLKTYFLRDPELIKHVIVKDFWNFPDRREAISTERDWLVNRALILLPKDRWRVTRPKFAPMFTSSNNRKAFALVDKNSDRLLKYLLGKAEGNAEFMLDLEGPCYKYGLDMSASISGVEVDVYSKIGRQIEERAKRLNVAFTLPAFLNLLLIRWFPSLANYFNLSVTDPKSLDYFGQLFKSALSNREAEGSGKKVDMLDHIVAMKQFPKSEDGSEGFDQKDVEASVMQLFFGGLDSTAAVMTFALYHLACNPEIQEKVRAEVDAAWEQNGGSLSHDTIKGMLYLDMVFKEVVRIHPPIWEMDRTCRSPIGVPLPGTDLVVKDGELLIVSIHALHNDPQYYPDPHLFIPERFTEENFSKIPPFAYIPFAAGPKRCIAVDFAPFQIKAAISKILRHFRVEATEETQIPVKFLDGMVLQPKGELLLKFVRIKNKKTS